MAINKKKKDDDIELLICPVCHGSGVIQDKDCPECKKIGMVFWTGSRLLYWGKNIDTLYIIQNKIFKIINNTINSTLLVLGIVGAILLFWQLIILSKNSQSLLSLWEVNSWQMFIFWITIITDSYLVYRYSQEYSSIKYIPKNLYQIEKPFLPQKINWLDIENIKSEQKIDISKLYSNESLKAIEKSWQLAKGAGHYRVTPLHLLISLLTFKEITNIFVRLGISFTQLENKIIHALNAHLAPSDQKLHYTPEFQRVLFSAFFEAWNVKQKRVELTEILTALVKESKIVNEILYDLKIDIDKINNVALWMRVRKMLKASYERFRSKASLRPKSTMNRAMTAVATPFLDSFSQDLTQLAKMGYLEPCIDREKEIEDILRIVQSSNRPSVILVGNPGVGKKTIINGLAQLMVTEEVPKILQDKRLVSLSVAKLISGVSPSEASQRLLIIINEIVR